MQDLPAQFIQNVNEATNATDSVRGLGRFWLLFVLSDEGLVRACNDFYRKLWKFINYA